MDVSVICPFYNEAEIIKQAIQKLLEALNSLDCEWELLVVNDGSTDDSEKIAEELRELNPNLHLLGYEYNRGRGFALRTGINAARGKTIVTTEIDLSWGTEIVHKLVAEMKASPDIDILIASPNLPTGGYKNVPLKRVLVSRIGNRIIRACMTNAVTMNTGMTRAYRNHVIKTMPLTESGKEFHLEVILKAEAFGYTIREIPALLEWKEYKHRGNRVKRRSSSNVNRLLVSHSLFSLFANPVRYVWGISFASMVLGIISFVGAVILAYLGFVSAYTAILSVILVILSIVLFVLGVVLKQGNMVQRELWFLRGHFLSLQKGQLPDVVKSNNTQVDNRGSMMVRNSGNNNG